MTLRLNLFQKFSFSTYQVCFLLVEIKTHKSPVFTLIQLLRVQQNSNTNVYLQKINSIIDAKTRLVDNLDRQNIEINKQYGIEAPTSGGLASLSGIVGQVLQPKLQLLGPKIQAVTSLLGGASGGSSSQGGSGGGGLGSILSLVTSLSGSSSGGGGNAGGTVETIDSSEEDDS